MKKIAKVAIKSGYNDVGWVCIIVFSRKKPTKHVAEVPTGHEKKKEAVNFLKSPKRARNDCNEKYLSKKEI